MCKFQYQLFISISKSTGIFHLHYKLSSKVYRFLLDMKQVQHSFDCRESQSDHLANPIFQRSTNIITFQMIGIHGTYGRQSALWKLIPWDDRVPFSKGTIPKSSLNQRVSIATGFTGKFPTKWQRLCTLCCVPYVSREVQTFEHCRYEIWGPLFFPTDRSLDTSDGWRGCRVCLVIYRTCGHFTDTVYNVLVTSSGSLLLDDFID